MTTDKSTRPASTSELRSEITRLKARIARQERTIETLWARDAERAQAKTAAAAPDGASSGEAFSDEGGALYHHLIELLPDAIVICDERGRLQFVNPAGAAMLGAEAADELLGRSLWGFVPDADRPAVKERQRQLHEGQRVDFFEHHIQQLGGARVPVETASMPIRYQGGAAVLIAARDLRRRRQIEQELSASQDLFYNAFHLGPAALAVARLDGGAFVDVNERFEELTGYTREELTGQAGHERDLWVNPSVRQAALRTMEQQGGRVQDVESQLRRKDGSVRFVITSAQRAEIEGETCLLTSTVDITRRKQAQKAERESRALLYKIFHASPAAITITRAADGRIIDANDEACHLYGMGRDALLGRTTTEMSLWTDQREREELVTRLERENAVHDIETRVRIGTGAMLDVLLSVQRIQVRGEACLLAVGTDITARKEAEAALRQAKDEAEEMARFRTGVLTNMTHEIRTPLTVVLGFTSILRQGVRKEYKRFVDLIERSGRRLLLTLDSVLDLAQLEAGTLEVEVARANVLDVVNSAVGAYRPAAEESGLAFDLELPGGSLYASFDYEVLSRALSHLLDNAVKFTNEGRVAVTVRSDEERAYIEVADTGAGIDAAFLPNIFDSFAQESTGLARTHQGSGLGLTVSKQLIERIGGTLQVESEKGVGSTFTIKLPRTLSANASAA